jgi:hypothetical protein
MDKYNEVCLNQAPIKSKIKSKCKQSLYKQKNYAQNKSWINENLL